MVVDGLSVVNTKELVEQRRAAGSGGHGFVLGCAGSGKTLVLKEQIRNIVDLSKDTVLILDTNGSYGALADALGGQVVPVEAESGVHINPLDIDTVCMSPDDDFIGDKVDFVRSLLEELWGREMTPRQISMVHRCVMKVYAPFFGSVDVVSGKFDRELVPSLRDLHKVLCSYDDADARLMAEILWPFVNGCFNEFGEKTDVTFDRRLVVYDFFNIRGPFLGAALISVLEFVRSQEASCEKADKASQRRLWVFVDDMCLFLRSEASVEFLLDFCNSAHFYGCIFTGATQNVSDFFNWEASRELLVEADYLHLLKLSKADEFKLSEFGLNIGN